MKSSAFAPLAPELLISPSIPEHIAWNDVSGALVLFDTRDGSYHALNNTASQIWRGIANGDSVQDVARDCAVLFCVEDSLAAEAVARFVDEAVALGLLINGRAAR